MLLMYRVSTFLLLPSLFLLPSFFISFLFSYQPFPSCYIFNISLSYFFVSFQSIFHILLPLFLLLSHSFTHSYCFFIYLFLSSHSSSLYIRICSKFRPCFFQLFFLLMLYAFISARIIFWSFSFTSLLSFLFYPPRLHLSTSTAFYYFSFFFLTSITSSTLVFLVSCTPVLSL